MHLPWKEDGCLKLASAHTKRHSLRTEATADNDRPNAGTSTMRPARPVRNLKSRSRKRSHAAEPSRQSDPKNLKSLPWRRCEKKLGSSPDGLTQAEAQKRLTQYGPNEIEEKKTNEFLKFLTYFWGPDPVDDRSRRDPFGGRAALAGLWHHPGFACGQRPRRILGRTPGGQRNRCPEGQAGDQGAGETRWKMGQPAGARAGAGRRHPFAPRRHCAGRCEACWRAIRSRWISRH